MFIIWDLKLYTETFCLSLLILFSLLSRIDSPWYIANIDIYYLQFSMTFFFIKKTFSLQINRLALLFYLYKGIFLTTLPYVSFWSWMLSTYNVFQWKEKCRHFVFEKKMKLIWYFKDSFKNILIIKMQSLWKHFKMWHAQQYNYTTIICLVMLLFCCCIYIIALLQ